MSKGQITVYGTGWCPDCIRAKHFLDSRKIKYNYINIDQDEKAAAKVAEMNNGMQSIPTIVFPDGSMLVEPGSDDLEKALDKL